MHMKMHKEKYIEMGSCISYVHPAERSWKSPF